MENEIMKNEDLFVKITSLIEESRHHIATAVNTAMVITYFEIGRYIVQDEQKGSNRAEYGKSVLKELSSKLTERFEKGWSVENLQNIRNFYLAYSQKYETVFHKSSDSDLVNSVYEIQNPLLEMGKGFLFEARQKRFTFDEEQMYVNYFDRYVKQDFENPTIGILLCKEKKDTLVELTLPKDSNIYAQEYSLYLPDKKLLQQKVKEWIAEFEDAAK